MNEKTYPSGEGLGDKRRFIRTGEFRAPRKGEWYLSGAIPGAYCAPNDLPTQHHILKPVTDLLFGARKALTAIAESERLMANSAETGKAEDWHSLESQRNTLLTCLKELIAAITPY